MLKFSFISKIILFLTSSSVAFNALGAPIESHRAEIAEIGKKTLKFERRIADLQKRKMQAREGEELESVLSEIGDVHKELLSLRRDRNGLKQHLLTEHPESNLIYDPSLYKKFDKKKANQRGPLDDRLDALLDLMQAQYSKFLPARVKEEPVVIPRDAPIEAEVPKITEKAPSATAEVKEKYLQEQIRTEMKLGSPQDSGAKKTETVKKNAAKQDKASEAPKVEPSPKKPTTGNH